MLKPFRIKELNDPIYGGESLPSTQTKSEHPVLSFSDTISSSLPRGFYDGVVRITANEYEETISNNSETKLSYVDEDDGERVTVGSSLELKQRLDDPLPSFSSKYPLLDRTGDKLEPMHIFDIGKHDSVVDTWRGYQARPSEDYSTLRTSTLAQHNTLSYDSLLTCKSPAREQGGADWENKTMGPAERWTAFCNPPRLSNELGPVEPQYKSKDFLHDLNESPREAPKWIAIPPRPNNDSGAASPSLPITEKGKKQAQDAGKKLRDSRNLYQLKGPPLFDAASKKENFWSSYQQFGSSEPLSQREPDSDESPIEEKSQPLLTAFESELSKLMKGQEKSETVAKNLDPSLDPSAITETEVEPTSSANTSSTEPRAVSPDMFGQAFQTIIGRITQVTSELTSRLPEVEQRLTSMQEQIPLHMQATVQDTIKAMGCHVQTLSGIMQHATVTARSATNRTMEAENLFTSQANGLRALADELRQVGQSLLEVFEAGGPQPASATPVPNSSSTRSGGVEHELNNRNDPTISTPSGNIHGEPSKDSGFIVPPPILSKQLPKPPSETNKAKSPGESETPSQDTLLVSNLSSHTTEDKLTSTLASKGFLGTVSLPRDSCTHKHLGFGTIRFPSPYAASGALKALTGAHINGKLIDIEFLEGPAPKHLEKSQEETAYNTNSGSLTLGHKKPLKSRPSVTFDPIYNSTSNSGLRRAKSLGTLRSHKGKRDGNSKTSNAPQYMPTDGHARQRPFDHHRPSRCVMRKRSLQNPSELPDQDAYPDLSLQYPSLINSKITGAAPRPGTNMDSQSFMEFVNSRYSEPSLPTNPSMGQLNGPSRFKSMPTASSGPYDNDQLRGPGYSKFEVHPSSPPAVPDKLPGSWPWEYESQKWDVIGHHNRPHDDEDLIAPIRRAKTTISRQPTQKPRVEITPSSLYDNPWVARTTKWQQYRSELPPKNEHLERDTTPLRRSDLTVPHVPGTFPLEAEPYATTEGQPAGNVEICVRHLQTLGFENEAGQDTTRLRIFAEAANGKLEEAIEMIEEERKAYEQRPRFAEPTPAPILPLYS